LGVLQEIDETEKIICSQLLYLVQVAKFHKLRSFVSTFQKQSRDSEKKNKTFL